MEWVKNRLVKDKGCAPEGNRVILLSGSGKGLSLIARTMCQEGDEAYCDAFCFMNATANMRNVGAAAVGIPGDDQGMIPEALEERARSGKGKYIYLIPNFHNPMGITIPLQRRKDLYAVACKYDLVIYEDDPYGDIRFAGEPVPAFKSLDTDNRVVYAGSFSKTLSAGLRAGYLYAPEGLAGYLAAVKTADGQEPLLNQQDYAKAFTYLDKVDWNCHPAFYLLGKMYCNGLGVPTDIAKGVEYLQKAGDEPDAKEELRHYKKTLFGKWVRQ